MSLSSNSDIEEIVSVKSVDVYHLKYNDTCGEYELTSVIKDQTFRVFREVIDGRLDPKQRELSQRLALIKCKDWFYPLEKDTTPIFRYRNQCLCYLFPDVSNVGSMTLLFINTEVVDDIKVLLLENVLLLYCDLKDSPQEWKPIIDQLLSIPSTPTEAEVAMETSDSEPMPLGASTVPSPGITTETEEQSGGVADTIAKGIIQGAELLNNGITYGAQVANDWIKRGASHVKTSQSTNTSENREVDPRVISGLRGLRTASNAAVSVTGFAVNAVAKGTNQLGKCLAPHVKRHSKKLISNVSGKSDNESEKICDGILTVASGTLQGFGTLYNGVTENAILLAKTISNETVGIVNQKYGQQPADATEHALYTAGNAAITLQNVSNLGPKAIAKRAAFDTGMTVIVGKQDNTNSQESQQKLNDNTY
ncbi:spartin-like [Oppia nitens]|uniref:spartin-like n=1 Tax=Oppia nitens TaxID=1686743 RepID=UPI0023DBF503|nr:spartin-like [Oppia nitens]